MHERVRSEKRQAAQLHRRFSSFARNPTFETGKTIIFNLHNILQTAIIHANDA